MATKKKATPELAAPEPAQPTTITILSRWTGGTIYTHVATDATVRAAVLAAVGAGANLGGANLGGANLGGADLRGANLGGADLRGADLRDADLRGADLRDADLRGADLRDADLRGANLGGANLGGANLRGANLGGANLRGANLGDANLRGANLGGANLRGANLGDANLRGANLGDANLRGANLGDANLRGANLGGADLRGAAHLPGFQIPQEGELIVWKKLRGRVLAKLRIPADAARTATPVGRKCRAAFADVLLLEDASGAAVSEARSLHDSAFLYRVGERVTPDSYNADTREECLPGIHFFQTKEEAQAYN
ncbi:MAG: pentapeptide repeat-containing protein [Janthinobacterium lividum]